MPATGDLHSELRGDVPGVVDALKSSSAGSVQTSIGLV